MNAKTNSSHNGVSHWWQQRLSSLLLIPLCIWLLWAGISLAGADYGLALEFFKQPFQKGMALSLIAISAFHAQSGIQVICEDYIPAHGMQSGLIWFTRIACLIGFGLFAYAMFNLPAGVSP